jgi:hypothetical protein
MGAVRPGAARLAQAPGTTYGSTAGTRPCDQPGARAPAASERKTERSTRVAYEPAPPRWVTECSTLLSFRRAGRLTIFLRETFGGRRGGEGQSLQP